MASWALEAVDCSANNIASSTAGIQMRLCMSRAPSKNFGAYKDTPAQ
jgi:hypothetical protein